MSQIPRTTMQAGDLASEALSGILARPGRTTLTVLGTVLGIGALVATLGIARTAGNQIIGRFDELSATSVVVTNDIGSEEVTLPADAEKRLTRLNGVNAAGSFGLVNIGDDLVHSVPLTDPIAQTEFRVDVYAVSPGFLAAVKGELAAGRFFDAGHSTRADQVVVLGPGVARRLNITRVDQQPVAFINERPFAVIGVIADLERQPQMLHALMIPEGTARAHYGYSSATAVQIDVAMGAGSLIAMQAPIALYPDEPDALQVEKPPEPADLRRSVETDVNAVLLVLGGVSLLVGAIGIANVTLVSVLERIGEIGLRRALGATRRHIAAQFLLESTTMGLIGGIIGASTGILVIVVTSAARRWTPVLDPWLPFAAPAVAALTGLLAGLYPALRAARYEPVDALRSS